MALQDYDDWFTGRTIKGVASGRDITISGVVPCTAGHPGWESSGPRNGDGIETQMVVAQAVERLAKTDRARDNGANLSAAITALHAQHTHDGRPAVFVPNLALAN